MNDKAINSKINSQALLCKKVPAIDPFGSEGFEVDLLMYKNKIYGAIAREGVVNQYALINKKMKFGYPVFNREDRITQPMVRKNAKLCPISIEKAIQLIKNEVSKVKSEENLICISPTLTNESMYMIQKWARAGMKTNMLGSASQINKGLVFNLHKNDNLPLFELTDAKRIYVFGTNLTKDHSVISHLVKDLRFINQIPVTYITQKSNCFYSRRVDETVRVSDYHSFIRAINYHLLQSKKAFGIFLDRLNEYKESILQENYENLLEKSGVNAEVVEKIAQEWIDIPKSVIIVSEKTIDKFTFCEMKKTMYLTEKQGKISSGMMILKAACNSQGLFDMGITPEYGPGFRKIEGDYLDLLKKVWKTDYLSTQFGCVDDILIRKTAKNIFIFGENPHAEHPETADIFKSANFICTQSLFENETTDLADLVLPMNFAIEIGGTFTTSFKMAQTFNAVKACEFGWNDYQFYAQLQEAFGLTASYKPDDIFLEIISLLQPSCCINK